MRRHGIRPCANEGCARQAPPGEPFCETCGIERELYRRDTRCAHADRPSGAWAKAGTPADGSAQTRRLVEAAEGQAGTVG